MLTNEGDHLQTRSINLEKLPSEQMVNEAFALLDREKCASAHKLGTTLSKELMETILPKDSMYCVHLEEGKEPARLTLPDWISKLQKALRPEDQSSGGSSIPDFKRFMPDFNAYYCTAKIEPGPLLPGGPSRPFPNLELPKDIFKCTAQLPDIIDDSPIDIVGCVARPNERPMEVFACVARPNERPMEVFACVARPKVPRPSIYACVATIEDKPPTFYACTAHPSDGPSTIYACTAEIETKSISLTNKSRNSGGNSARRA